MSHALPFIKAFPADWEVAMRKATIPQADRGNVYRLIFFAWSEGGIDHQDTTKMKHLANEMGIQWRVFSRHLEQYAALCGDEKLPEFLLANHKEMTNNIPANPKVSPSKSQSFTENIPANPKVSPPNGSEIPKFDDQNTDKTRQITPKSNESSRANTSEVRSQRAESDAHAQEKPVLLAPNDDFAPEKKARSEEELSELFVLAACGLWSEFGGSLAISAKTQMEVALAGKAIKPYLFAPRYKELVHPEGFRDWFHRQSPAKLLPAYVAERWTDYLADCESGRIG